MDNSLNKTYNTYKMGVLLLWGFNKSYQNIDKKLVDFQKSVQSGCLYLLFRIKYTTTKTKMRWIKKANAFFLVKSYSPLSGELSGESRCAYKV